MHVLQLHAVDASLDVVIHQAVGQLLRCGKCGVVALIDIIANEVEATEFAKRLAELATDDVAIDGIIGQSCSSILMEQGGGVAQRVAVVATAKT